MSALIWPVACCRLLQSRHWFRRFSSGTTGDKGEGRSASWSSRCCNKRFQIWQWEAASQFVSGWLKTARAASWGTSWDLLLQDIVESWLQWEGTSHVCRFCERCNAKGKQWHISVKQTEVIQSKHRRVTCTGNKHNADDTFLHELSLHSQNMYK